MENTLKNDPAAINAADPLCCFCAANLKFFVCHGVRSFVCVLYDLTMTQLFVVVKQILLGTYSYSFDGFFIEFDGDGIGCVVVFEFKIAAAPPYANDGDDMTFAVVGFDQYVRYRRRIRQGDKSCMIERRVIEDYGSHFVYLFPLTVL